MVLLTGIQCAHRIFIKRLSKWGGLGCYIISLGLIVMSVGSALEFWVFTETSYGSNSVRHWGFGTYSICLLVFYIGTAILGAVLIKARGLETVGVLFLAWLPMGALSVGFGALTGLSLPAFSIAAAICGIGFILFGLRSDERRTGLKTQET